MAWQSGQKAPGYDGLQTRPGDTEPQAKLPPAGATVSAGGSCI